MLTDIDTRLFWITGAYFPSGRSKKRKEWVTFAYGPFPNLITCEVVAADDAMMFDAIGPANIGVYGYEIDCTDRLRYNQACKHFEETIQSEYFEEWYKER